MIKNISSLKAYEALNSSSSNSIILDVRTVRELYESGTCGVKNTLHIEYDFYNEENFISNLVDKISDKDLAVFLICRSGKRSCQAALLMRNNGYLDCANIEDGFIGNDYGAGWVKNKLPIKPYIG